MSNTLPFDIHGALTLAEFTAAEALFKRELINFGRGLIGVLAFLCFSVSAYGVTGTPVVVAALFGLGLLGVAFGGYRPLVAWAAARSYATHGPPPLDYTVNEEGISTEAEGEMLTVPWINFGGYREDGRVLLLFLSNKHYLTFPKRLLDEAQQQQLRRLSQRAV